MTIYLDPEVYDRLVLVTGTGSDRFYGRSYGAISKIISLAIGHYLDSPALIEAVKEKQTHELADL